MLGMDRIFDFKLVRKPLSLAVVVSLVAAITVPAAGKDNVCEADPPYRAQHCDTPGLVVVSSGSAASFADTHAITVADQVVGEFRAGPPGRSISSRLISTDTTGPTAVRWRILPPASNGPPVRRPTFPIKGT